MKQLTDDLELSHETAVETVDLTKLPEGVEKVRFRFHR